MDMEVNRRMAETVRRYGHFPTKAKCRECERVFDLTADGDAQEWYYGHDCEG